MIPRLEQTRIGQKDAPTFEGAGEVLGEDSKQGRTSGRLGWRTPWERSFRSENSYILRGAKLESKNPSYNRELLHQLLLGPNRP